MVMGVLSSALDLAKAAVSHDEQGMLPHKVLPYYKKVGATGVHFVSCPGLSQFTPAACHASQGYHASPVHVHTRCPVQETPRVEKLPAAGSTVSSDVERSRAD